MPQGILPNEGIGAQLGYILSAPIMGVLPWELLLWVNDVVPTADTVWADLVEATFTGYHRVSMSRNTWTTPAVSGGCAVSTLSDVPVVWTNNDTTSPTIYGLAYLDQSSGVLRFVQRFDDGDIRALVPNATLTVLPQYTLCSASCSQVQPKTRVPAARKRKGFRS